MKLSATTQLVGLLGWPVSHSFSPKMHNAAFVAAGLDWRYVALPVRPNLVETAVRGLPALGFRGVNVTIPHKQAVMPFLDKIEEGAKAIGAVNTLTISQDETPILTGHNTDWSGFLADLAEQGVDLNGRSCLILGAGGSARAVLYGMLQGGVTAVTILSRRPEQAIQLVNDMHPYAKESQLKAKPLNALASVAKTVSSPLIINTTPLGMSPHPNRSIWPADVPFPQDSVIYDLVYNPRQTKLMQQATDANCQASNGLGMLIHQGAKAFELWTGVTPDVATMRSALESGG